MGWDKNDIAFVSGIGCTSRAPGYIDCNTLHTTHGRALSFATGIKMVQPAKHIVVFSGDGDATAIGGNHFIHACRRNIDLTCVLINNNIYGMTGGQGSPTTPAHAFSTTTPYGNSEKQFDPCGLAKAAGASFVGRGTVYHTPQLEKLIIQAIEHRGFSLVEAISNCHTYYGRLNKQGDAVTMINDFKDRAVPLAKAQKMTPEELKGKHVIGVLHQDDRTEFCDVYDNMMAQMKGGK
jgi:2-oxoglutarate ferredoxin oxidoreductase subunit beta